MTLLPILGPSHEWFTLKQAAYYSGLADRTLRDWVKIHGIGRQSGKGRIEIAIVGLEMVRCGDLATLELLRAGQRSHQRVAHYIDRLTELGVFSRSKANAVAKPLPTAANPPPLPDVLLSDQSSGSPDGPVAPDFTPSGERDIRHMREDGSHAKVAERIRAILRSEEGQFMPNLANALAFDLDMSASEALKILEIAAKEKRSQIASLAETKRLGLQ